MPKLTSSDLRQVPSHPRKWIQTCTLAEVTTQSAQLFIIPTSMLLKGEPQLVTFKRQSRQEKCSNQQLTLRTSSSHLEITLALVNTSKTTKSLRRPKSNSTRKAITASSCQKCLIVRTPKSRMTSQVLVSMTLRCPLEMEASWIADLCRIQSSELALVQAVKRLILSCSQLREETSG